MPDPVHDPQSATLMELVRTNNKYRKALRGHAVTVRTRLRENEQEIKARLGRELSLEPGQLMVTYAWKCTKDNPDQSSMPAAVSPIGYCVYNRVKDPCLDECLYCGQPEERK